MKNSVLAFGFLLVNTAAFVSCSQKDQDINPVNAAQRNSASLSGRVVKELSKPDVSSSTPVENSISAPALCQLKVNGDGFRNQTIELGNIPSSSIGIFSADGKSTYFSMSSNSGYSVAGVFPGQAAGISSNKTSMTLIAYGKTYVADSGVEISVKEYGEIGEKIKGSFSGTFKRYDVDMKTGKHLEYNISVKDGNFEVVRQADI